MVAVAVLAVGALGGEVALAGVLATVDEVDGLTPDVGVALVHGAGLPLVDQVRGVLRVGVGPLVGDHVVGRDAVAEQGVAVVPAGVGTTTRPGVAVDGDQVAPLAVVAVASPG